MVESTAFFEAYRHVLEGLKETEQAEVPFQVTMIYLCRFLLIVLYRYIVMFNLKKRICQTSRTGKTQAVD